MDWAPASPSAVPAFYRGVKPPYSPFLHHRRRYLHSPSPSPPPVSAPPSTPQRMLTRAAAKARPKTPSPSPRRPPTPRKARTTPRKPGSPGIASIKDFFPTKRPSAASLSHSKAAKLQPLADKANPAKRRLAHLGDGDGVGLGDMGPPTEPPLSAHKCRYFFRKCVLRHPDQVPSA